MTELNYRNILFKYLLLCCLFVCITSLTLESLTTRKPRLTKYMTTSSPLVQNGPKIEESTTTQAPSSVIYRLMADNGATCILMKTDALLSIKYIDISGEEQEGDTFVPENPKVTGDCTNEDVASMAIDWPNFHLNFRFEKTPGGERWYLDKVESTFHTQNKIFGHAIDTKHNREIHLSTSEVHSAMLFPTPVGKSYTCSDEIKVNLLPVETHVENFRGILYLRELRLQPFMYKNNDFGPPFQCSVAGYMRDETAPLAVGLTLAIAVLGTITGYGLFRYFKVKKVQYNTME